MNNYKSSESVSEYNLNTQTGFTLVELLVALILGVLIAGAATQILITSTKNQSAQAAASQIQDDGIFGLQMLKEKILLANLGARNFKVTGSSNYTSQYVVTDDTRQGGVVLTAPELDSGKAKNVTNLAKLKYNNSEIESKILSHDGSSSSLPADQKASNLVGTASDQLTIQYSAPYDMYDCQGNNVKLGQYVIERYFVRAEGSDTALACNAAIYDYSATANDIDISTYNKYDTYEHGSTSNTAAISGTGTNDLYGKGMVILPRVDSFQVQLGVTDKPDFATDPEHLEIRYMTIEEYKNLTATPKPRIVNIKTSVLVRSLNVPTNDQNVSEMTFDMLNEQKKKLVDGSSKQLRNIYTSTTLIRNGRGNS